MDAKATAKTVRVQPRKVRLALDMIRGKDIKEATALLKFSPNKSSACVAKVLHSAVANATNNHQLTEEKLFVKVCFCDEGVTLKRFMPRAKGSAASIFKRTSHITVIVAEKN